MKNLFIITAIIFSVVACSEKPKDDLIGPSSDTIKLSVKELIFDVEGGTQTITTQSDRWTFVSYRDNKTKKEISVDSMETSGEVRVGFNGNTSTFTTLKGDGFVVERDPTNITITLSKNLKNEDRDFTLGISDFANRSDYITITQKGGRK